MRRLAIETAGSACSIALIEDGAVIAERHETVGRGHAERLIPWIAELPDGGKADEIIVGCGPGSFTGVRIGIAAARALGLGWDVPVRGMSSLMLIAAGCSAQSFAVAVEGGHGEILVQPFAREPLRALAEFVSLTPKDAARVFGEDLVIGSAADRLVSARGFGSAHASEARASCVAIVPTEHFYQSPTPIYARLPDAKRLA